MTPGAYDELPPGALATLSRGVRVVPELTVGILGTVLLALVGAAGRVVVPILVQQAIDRGIRGGQVRLDLVLWMCAVGAALVVITTAAQRAAAARLGVRAEEALYALRVRLFHHLHHLSLADHAEQRRGALVSRVTSDMETLTQFFAWGGVGILLDSAVIVLVGSVMIAYDWLLAVVAFIVAAPLIWVLRAVQRRLVEAYDSARARTAEMLTSTSEMVMGGSTIRAYGAADLLRSRIFGIAKQRSDSMIRAGTIGAFLFPSGEVFSVLTIGAVVGVGVARGASGGVTAGALVGFVFLTARLLEPVGEFTELLDQTQSAVAGMRRILGVLDIPTGPPQPEVPRPLPPGALGVHLDEVTFSYPPRPGDDELPAPALKDVTVGVLAGEQVAVVGATGSGKSTLALLMTRLADPVVGHVRVGGVDLREVTNDELRSRVVLVPQDPFLFEGTIEHNLLFAAPGADHTALEDAFARLGLGDWLAGLPDGLATPVGERGNQLSAGERQLVALVRAALVDPSVLVLDEATSSVDPITETRLGRALDRLAEGRTTIAIAHRLSTAARAQRVLVFERGRLVEHGSHADLLEAGGVYAGLYAHWLAATEAPGG